MNTIYYVYFHRNSKTNEVFYVGMGKNKRYIKHSNRTTYWKNYVNKYGFYSEIRIKNISKERALYFENKYIKFFGRKINNTGCLINITEGLGRINDSQSLETRKKISRALKDKKKSINAKLNMSIAQTGKVRTKEHKDNISKNSKNKKAILQYDLEGNFIREWESINQAAKFFNVSKGFVGNVLRNIKNNCKGFKFKYK